MYELRSVTKCYPKGSTTVEALRDVDLVIDQGEFLAIQGPTGQGKTTLMQLLGALDRPTTGSVMFEGRDLTRLSEGRLTDLRARNFGFVFQGFNLIPTLNARENVETALVPLGVSSVERRRRAQATMEELGLGDRMTHLPSELSGGEQQRVAIARALVGGPKVILADEPTGNLDEGTRDEIMGLLERLWTDRGQTLVLVTHDSGLARRAPRRAWIRDGRLSLEEGADLQPGAAAAQEEATAPAPAR